MYITGPPAIKKIISGHLKQNFYFLTENKALRAFSDQPKLCLVSVVLFQNLKKWNISKTIFEIYFQIEMKPSQNILK